jgi:hypothetical protein
MNSYKTKKQPQKHQEETMKKDPLSIEADGLVCDLLMKHIGRPKNLITCRAINLWDNRYRINVYTKYIVDGIDSRKISYSCFAKLDDNELTIISQTEVIKPKF